MVTEEARIKQVTPLDVIYEDAGVDPRLASEQFTKEQKKILQRYYQPKLQQKVAGQQPKTRSAMTPITPDNGILFLN